jgi:PAS domain S-box-containing protein
MNPRDLPQLSPHRMMQSSAKPLMGRLRRGMQSASQIFGYEAEEMIGEPIIRVIPPELHAKEKQILAQLRRASTSTTMKRCVSRRTDAS